MSKQLLTASANLNSRVDNNYRNTVNKPANSTQTGQAGNQINSKKSAVDITEERDQLRDNLRRMGCYMILDAYEDLKRWIRPQSRYTENQLKELKAGDVLDDLREFFFGEDGVDAIIEVYQISINADTIRAVAGRMIAQAEAFIAGEDAEEVDYDLSAILNPAPVPAIKTVAPVPAIKANPINRGGIKKAARTFVPDNVIMFPVFGKNSAGLGDVPVSSDYTDMFADYVFSPKPTQQTNKSSKYVRNKRRHKGDLEGQMHFPFLEELQVKQEFALAA